MYVYIYIYTCIYIYIYIYMYVYINIHVPTTRPSRLAIGTRGRGGAEQKGRTTMFYIRDLQGRLEAKAGSNYLSLPETSLGFE